MTTLKMLVADLVSAYQDFNEIDKNHSLEVGEIEENINIAMKDSLLDDVQFIDWLIGRVRLTKNMLTRRYHKSYLIRSFNEYCYTFNGVKLRVQIDFTSNCEDITINVLLMNVDSEARCSLAVWDNIDEVINGLISGRKSAQHSS